MWTRKTVTTWGKKTMETPWAKKKNGPVSENLWAFFWVSPGDHQEVARKASRLKLCEEFLSRKYVGKRSGERRDKPQKMATKQRAGEGNSRPPTEITEIKSGETCQYQNSRKGT